jgi:UDP-N-acetylglucosamine 2-epimerase (non-hydrolysing)
MNEVLSYYMPKILKSGILTELNLQSQKYFVLSTHREENVDNPENLQKILFVINQLAEKYNYPVIVSTHPRTRKRIEMLPDARISDLVKFLKPFGFLDYIHLQQHALCTISDSGTISEESSILNFPAISLRQSMERPEAQDTGSITLTGFNPDVVLNSIALAVDEPKERMFKEIPADYSIKDTSWRVVKLVMGNCKLSNKWNSITEK